MDLSHLSSKTVRYRNFTLHLALVLAGALALAAARKHCGAATFCRRWAGAGSRWCPRNGSSVAQHAFDRRNGPSGEAFYYISQKASRSVAFLPHEVVDQRVARLFRQRTACEPSRTLRRKGPQGLRLLFTDDADRGPGINLPAQYLQERRLPPLGVCHEKGPARTAHPFPFLLAPSGQEPRAAIAPRCS